MLILLQLLQLGNRRDQFHHQAMFLCDDLIKMRRPLVTTSAVLMEFGNAFSPVPLRPTAIRFIEMIKKSQLWQVIAIDVNLLDQGIDQFRKMSDKNWGLIDCVSMVVAKTIGASEIFTNDHHFEQAGFVILMK